VLNGVRGLDIIAAELARQMDRPVWRGPRFVVRRIPNWATFPWGMVDVFRSFGMRSSWRPLVSYEYLRENLPRGRVLMPIIHSWKPLWSHVMTLLAWDEKKGWGFANTQYAHHNLNWVSDATFRKQWGALGRLLIEVRNA
jgi:hypothetical protein